MSRETKLLKNTGIIAIGQLSSKLLSFLLLPLYTNLLLPDDFGVVDVLQTVISLVLYFATLQLESAVFRFIIEKRGNNKAQSEIISSALLIVIVTNILFTLLSFGVNAFYPIPHIIPFILSFWGLSMSAILLSISRGRGNNTLYAIASFCITISFLLTNIVMIVLLKMGAVSILWSLTISNMVGASVIFFVERVYKLIHISDFSVYKSKEMLKYSLPLIPNAISWWVANASNRFIIALFLGSTYNGIYAAANKIPTIYLTLFNVFNLAWSESVIVSINDKDRDKYINKILDRSYKLFSFVALGIICSIGLLFELLIGQNYYDAYYHIIILLIAIFFNSMCSMFGGVFTGFMDSKAISISTIIGAITNIIIDISLVKVCGLFSASISTLISYIVILLLRVKMCKKHMQIRISLGYSIQLIVVTAIVTICYLTKNKIIIAVSLAGIIVWGIFNNLEMITEFVKTFHSKVMMIYKK